MPFTSHGHYVPGLPQEERPANQVRTRCGGPGLCVKCSTEAASILRAVIREGNDEAPGRIGTNHE